jgi:hypothetical protein
VYGVVLSRITTEPIAGAKVSMYSSKTVSSSNGCFKLSLSSALPLTFSVTSPGFKAIEVPAQFGFYRVEVGLEPQSSSRQSNVVWHLAPEDEVLSATCNF